MLSPNYFSDEFFLNPIPAANASQPAKQQLQQDIQNDLWTQLAPIYTGINQVSYTTFYIRENIALRQSLTNPYNICIFKNIHNSGKSTGKAIKD